MIVLLWGPDEYRREEKRKELVRMFGEKHPYVRTSRFSLASPEGLGALKEFLGAQSLFDGARLGIIEDAYEGEIKKIKPLLLSATLAPESTLILSEKEKPPKTLAFLLDLKKKKEVLNQEFPILKGAEWNLFIKKEAEKRNISISSASLSIIATRFVGNSWGAITELEKIALFKESPTPKELESANPELGGDYWSVVNGVRGPSLAGRMRALCALEAMGEPGAKTFAILAASARTGKKAFATLDLQIKSGALEYEEALLDLALTFES